ARPRCRPDSRAVARLGLQSLPDRSFGLKNRSRAGKGDGRADGTLGRAPRRRSLGTGRRMAASISPSPSVDPHGAFVLIKRLLVEYGLVRWQRYALAFVLMGIGAGCTALAAYLMGDVVNEAFG